jgi:AcrR family transcriptional regulator
VRNQQSLLAAAAEVFVESGVDAPIRRIATRAGVGMGTIYRHFPTRADLVSAVYRHQIDACVEAGPRLLAEAESPFDALRRWIDLFVDFLVTKHGLAEVMRPDSDRFGALHTQLLESLLPVCTQLFDAAVAAGQIVPDLKPYELMRGIGNLCLGRGDDRYDPRRLIEVLLRGLRQPPLV